MILNLMSLSVRRSACLRSDTNRSLLNCCVESFLAKRFYHKKRKIKHGLEVQRLKMRTHRKKKWHKKFRHMHQMYLARKAAWRAEKLAAIENKFKEQGMNFDAEKYVLDKLDRIGPFYDLNIFTKVSKLI
ncbi:MAG: hypothetical protein MHPSP_000779 [Paramarteilia canceri]